MATSLVLTGESSFVDALWLCMLLGLLLWSLYLFNDLIDRAADRHNPRKQLAVVAAYEEKAWLYWGMWVGGSFMCLMLAYWLEPNSALWVGIVMLINVLYSLKVKSIPWIDVATVGAWGAVYTAVAMPAVSLCLVVGCMTMIAHVYQTRADRVVDNAQGIMTTAVRAPMVGRALVSCLALAMALIIGLTDGPVLAVVLAIAVAVPIWIFESNQWAWHGSRLLFGMCWLILIGFRVMR